MQMLSLFKVHSPSNIGEQIEKVFNSGFIGEGKYTKKFERKLSNFIGNENLSVVNSGTSALTIAYRLCELKSGDEVITTPMTCVATNQPLLYFGVKIVFADIDPRTGNIDPSDVIKKITPKTKAIVGVHWGGQPFDIGAINDIAKQYGLSVVEDAAHAIGAKYHGVSIGNHSDFCCFSFQAIKHLTTGDGGAIATKSNVLKNKIDKLRWYGLNRELGSKKWEQDIEYYGYKFHMNNLNAIIGLSQLKYLSTILNRHKTNGNFYDNNINNKKITLLKRDKFSEPSFWLYTLLINDDPSMFKKYMNKNNIEVNKVHIRNDSYSIFSSSNKSKLKGVDEFSKKMMNIPVGWWLKKSDLLKITNLINSY
jgi:perosamine synthetase